VGFVGLGVISLHFLGEENTKDSVVIEGKRKKKGSQGEKKKGCFNWGRRGGGVQPRFPDLMHIHADGLPNHSIQS